MKSAATAHHVIKEAMKISWWFGLFSSFAHLSALMPPLPLETIDQILRLFANDIPQGLRDVSKTMPGPSSKISLLCTLRLRARLYCSTTVLQKVAYNTRLTARA